MAGRDEQIREEERAVARARRRAGAALAVAPERWGGGRDAEVLRRLAGERITGMGRVVYSSNVVFVLEFEGPDPDHPDHRLRAVYKPARGERPLWDFPRRTLHLREVAAYAVSAAVGDAVVPPTVPRDGPHGPGSVQLFVHAADVAVPEAELEQQLRTVAALDVLINNADRKSAHLLLGDDGRVHGIDNALSFLPYPRQRTVLIELGGQRVPDLAMGRIANVALSESGRTALTDNLAVLLDRDEVRAFGERLDALVAQPMYPRLDPWDGRPFEWW